MGGAALLSKANDWTGIKQRVFTGVDLIPRYLVVVSTEPLDRAVALGVIGILLSYISSVYADIGQLSWVGVFLVCPALGLVGKLAVASGAWPARMSARTPALIAESEAQPG
jgi:hypothetical protein